MLKKYAIIFDVDGTLTEHRQLITNKMINSLKKLSTIHEVIILGAGSCQRIYNQLNKLDNITILGNYGLEWTIGINKELKILREHINRFHRSTTSDIFQKIREQFNLTKYIGESYEIHKTGMITFGLLGTKASIKNKLKFDPYKKIRNKILPELKKALPDKEIIIGGTSSFDILPKGINKLYAINEIRRSCDYQLIYIGDDFEVNGNDNALLQDNKLVCLKTKNPNQTLKIINILQESL